MKKRDNGDTAKNILSGLFENTACRACGGKLEPSSLYVCDACIKKQKEHEIETRAKAEERRAADIRNICRTMIPARFATASFGADDLARRVLRAEAINKARDAFGSALTTLLGGSASGKTTLAAAMFHDVAERAIKGDERAVELFERPLWVSATSLARARKDHRLGNGDAPLILRALAATLLVIDEVGAERDGEAVGEIVYERHAAMQPMIVTTGFHIDTLSEKYGDGVARRLVEAGQANVIRCDRSKS